MSNTFGKDILLQAPNPDLAAAFYVDTLGFTITATTTELISLEGPSINLYIERGPTLGPVLEVMVPNVQQAKLNLVTNGCHIIKDEPRVPRCYVTDPLGLTYNIRQQS